MEITRTFDFLDLIGEKYAHKEDMLAGLEDGKWRKYSAKEYIESSYNMAYGYLELGLKRGDRVLTISNNRPEWNINDMGIALSGVIQVPIYPTISVEEYDYIIGHCEPKYVVLSDKGLLDKIEPLAKKHKLKGIYTFNKIEGAKHWTEILELGKANADKHKPAVDKIKAEIKPEDLLTILYTSGTTGVPKGVMLSHNNLVTNTLAVESRFCEFREKRAISFLPISHVYERMVSYMYQNLGISIYYAENIGTIARDAQDVEPNIFTTVPRLLESVYDKIVGKGKDLTGVKKSIFFWALNLGKKFDPEKGNGGWYRMRLKIADKLVFSKWRAALGGCQCIVTGSAAIQPRLVKIFWAAGIQVFEGYGLTETSPVISVADHTNQQVRVGSCGMVIDGVDVKIADDGEIMAKGPNVMMGYYKDEAMTKEVIEPDGYFHTGDIGKLKDNWLYITDRKKEIFKLSSGKYIAPQAIENMFKESMFIEQLMVIGENQKFASAIIAPNFHFLHNWAQKHSFKFRDNKELIEDKRVLDRFQQEVSELNKGLGQVEQIKRFKLVTDNWTPEEGVMSPTMKLKRKVLAEKYKDLMEEIFAVDAEKE